MTDYNDCIQETQRVDGLFPYMSYIGLYNRFSSIKTLDFSLGVSQHMHNITKPVEI